MRAAVRACRASGLGSRRLKLWYPLAVAQGLILDSPQPPPKPPVAISRDGFEQCVDIATLSRSSSHLHFRAASTLADGPRHAEDSSDRAGPLSEYERRIGCGELVSGDKFQEDALRALQALYDVLQSTAANSGLECSSPTRSYYNGRGGNWLWSALMARATPPPVRGLYLYGGVGTGKTMLMDMFFDELPDTWRKRRIHFHDFMLSVHSLLQRSRGMSDPLGVVAEDIAREALLLCLDEFMVTDVADALILNRLFDHLFKQGVILVSTSNRAPDRLYEGGLQRDLFLPFIACLKERCVIHEIGSATDYRKLTAAERGLYFTGPEASELLSEKFRLMSEGESAEPQTVEVQMGRKLKVPKAAAGCAFFQFHELCEMPLGAADYIGLFEQFHTLVLDGVPLFGAHNRVSAYRFVTLIDVMYEHKARFVCSADAVPLELFKKVVTMADAPRRTSSRSSQHDEADLCVDNELGFAKDRTISRLTEMHSTDYLEDHAAMHLSGTSQQSPAITGTDNRAGSEG